jgi:hypothetical protein
MRVALHTGVLPRVVVRTCAPLPTTGREAA